MRLEFIIALTDLIWQHMYVLCSGQFKKKIFKYDDITNFFPDRVSSACLSNQQSIVAYVVWILETVLLTD